MNVKNSALIVTKNQPSGHLCHVDPLKSCKLTDSYLYVIFDTECPKDLEKSEGSLEYVPNLICAKQMYNKCPAVDDLSVDCEQCGKSTHMLWQDPVGKWSVQTIRR